MLAATSLLAVRINKCQHLTTTKNSKLCLENRRTLLEVFNESHGELPKGYKLIVTCNTSTDTSNGTSFEVQPNLLVGDIVTSLNIRQHLEYTCSKEEQTMDEIIKIAAQSATKQAVNAFQVLMARGGQKVTPKTSRYVLERELYNS